VVSEPGPGAHKRARNRERTRRALVTAALELFEARGYDGTTVAEIAGGADVSTRTFFAYFPNKEEVLFAGADERLARALDDIGAHRSTAGPADVLLRVLTGIIEDLRVLGDPFSRTVSVRLRLILTVPALQGAALRRAASAQRRLARRLHTAFPDDLDESTAAALVGASVGAVLSVLVMIGADGPQLARALAGDAEPLLTALRRGAVTALRGFPPPPPTG